MKEKVRKLESFKVINQLELGSIGEQEEARDSSRSVSKRANASSPTQLDSKHKKVSPEILVEETKDLETESCFGSQANLTQLATIEPAIEANINDLNQRSFENQVNAADKPKQNQEAPEFKQKIINALIKKSIVDEKQIYTLSNNVFQANAKLAEMEREISTLKSNPNTKEDRHIGETNDERDVNNSLDETMHGGLESKIWRMSEPVQASRGDPRLTSARTKNGKSSVCTIM